MFIREKQSINAHTITPIQLSLRRCPPQCWKTQMDICCWNPISSVVRICVYVRTKCVDFLSKIHVSELIWELPDLIWQLLERKVRVLDGRSEDFKKK